MARGTDPDCRRRHRDPHRAQPGAGPRRLRAARHRQCRDAVALGGQGEGDVVITDVVMPDENAFDLIPRIKKIRPDLPIIVMSAQNTLMTALTAAEKGALRVPAQALRSSTRWSPSSAAR